MFRHLVAAIDGSESSLRALDVAIDLAARAGAALDVVSVEEEAPRYVATHDELAAERSAADRYFAELHAEAVRRAERRGLLLRHQTIRGHEVQALIDYVCADGYDLIVVGHRGHSGVWGAFLGSTADKLVGHAPCSVLVAREHAAGMAFKRIMVGLDGSPLSRRAFEAALQLAKLWGASIHALSVSEGSPPDAGKGRAWATYLHDLQAAAAAEAQLIGVAFQAATYRGHAAAVIVGQARREDCDLIVVGATGHERPWSPTTGGTARKIANEAASAVLIIRPPLLARQVRHLMTREVATVAPAATTAQVVALLIRSGLKAVPVIDEGQRVVGIITGGDLLARGRLRLRLSVQRDLTPEELAEQIQALEGGGQLARDVMTPNPLTIPAAANIEQAIDIMASRNLKRLPVVDEAGRLVGIISRVDVLRHLASAPEPAPERHLQFPIRARTIGEVMDPNVPTVPSSTPAQVVLQQILSTPLRRVVVVDEAGKASGIIADRDLVAGAGPGQRGNLLRALSGLVWPRQAEGLAAHAGHGAGPVTAADLMKPHIFALRPEAPLVEAIRLMVNRQVKRLVVLDGDGKPVGIVDRQQLLRSLLAS